MAKGRHDSPSGSRSQPSHLIDGQHRNMRPPQSSLDARKTNLAQRSLVPPNRPSHGTKHRVRLQGCSQGVRILAEKVRPQTQNHTARENGSRPCQQGALWRLWAEKSESAAGEGTFKTTRSKGTSPAKGLSVTGAVPAEMSWRGYPRSRRGLRLQEGAFGLKPSEAKRESELMLFMFLKDHSGY